MRAIKLFVDDITKYRDFSEEMTKTTTIILLDSVRWKSIKLVHLSFIYTNSLFISRCRFINSYEDRKVLEK